ncbi:hypothetical protein NOF04DRAFT_1363739 [Fusarium oxysporum II5]|nr:hypothetical protein NOF04DRAFT_1363739 [Fusarium oxysporum II5]
MKVVRYEPFNRSNFEIVLQNSDERTVVPKVIINPCPSHIEDNDKTSDSKKDSGEEESDEGDGEDEQKTPKDNDEVQHGHASDSVNSLPTKFLSTHAMRSVTYVIDPRGDIEVVLAASKPIPRRSLPNGRCSSSPMTGEEDDEEEEDDSTIEMGTLDSLFYGTTNPQEKDREVEIRMRVSSYHLSLASPVLSTQLEVSRLQPTTRAARPANAIHLTGWDVKALATVLNIIHGQNSQVPRNVDFGFITHIAVVAHHLQCVEAVQLYSEMWLSSFRADKIPYFNSACLTITLIKKVFTALENLEQTLSTEHVCPEAGLEQCTAMALVLASLEEFPQIIMAVVTHDIAPDGDICIVLQKPNTQSVVPIVNLRQYGTEPPQYYQDVSSVGVPVWHSPALKDKKAAEYRLRVSSHHLTSVSPMFSCMLKGPWKESAAPDAATSSDSWDQTPAATAIREISATDWNIHALITVLNIIHGRHNEIPRQVSIKFIVDVAVIVNYYECAGSVTLAAELWRAGVNVPETYGKKSIMLLFVSWVFSWTKMFSSMAHLVLEQGEGSEHADTRNLPIAVIFETLDKKRELALPFVHKRLSNLRGDLLNSRIGCSPQCRHMLLGALESNKHDMHKALGSWDYEPKGVSVGRVLDALNSFPSPEWKDPKEKGQVHSRDCNVKTLMQPAFDKIREDFKKIKLADFQAKKV